MCKVIGTYDPSGLLDSGMTRSKVLGSTAIPATDLSGFIGGRDIQGNIIWKYLKNEDEQLEEEANQLWAEFELPLAFFTLLVVPHSKCGMQF
jgi:hypothetical protein